MFPRMLRLQPLVRSRRPRPGRWARGIAGALALWGCGKDAPAPAAKPDSVAVAPAAPATDSAAPPVEVRWDTTAGAAVYLPGDDGGAQVILPQVVDDSVPALGSLTLPAAIAPAAVDLFAPSGRVGTVSLGEYASAAQPEVGAGCDAWPVVPLRDAPGAGARRWKLAFSGGVAQAVAMDSIGALTRADSALLVVEINRAAALLQLDSAGVLNRVPFSVTSAHHARIEGGTELVVAIVERRLNLEASPRVERTALVLERASGARRYEAVWHDTQYAGEDDLIAIELLSAVRLGRGAMLSVFFGLDFGDGSRVQMLQRSARGAWAQRWVSAYTGC